jgi:hypothetical protein
MGQIGSNNINFAGRDDRQESGWVITTDRWKSAGAYIILPINPESLDVAKRMRASEVSMQSGKYIAVSRSTRRDSVYDFPVVSFKFNSGNIQPVFSDSYIKHAQQAATTSLNLGIDGSARTPNMKSVGSHRYGAFQNVKAQAKAHIPGLYVDDVPVGVQNLYAILGMMNDTWMLDVQEAGAKRSVLNRVIITSNSLAFPSLTFYGAFDDSGIQWGESAENFNNFDLSFNLMITHTNPSLDGNQIESLVRTYKKKMYQPCSLFVSAQPNTDGGVCKEHEQPPQPDAPSIEPEFPQTPLTWSDRIRQAVASQVGSTSTAVDYYAEKIKVTTDQQYAQQKQQLDYQRNATLSQYERLYGVDAELNNDIGTNNA